MGSFYVTLSERILLYFYGKKRKSLSTLEKWKEIFFVPSHCEFCSAKIPIDYLFPFFGYFLTRGKCFHCNKRIFIHYPLSELLFSFWFFIIFFLTENLFLTIFSTFLLGHVILSMITDVKKYILDYENIPFIILFYFLSSIFLWKLRIGVENFFVGLVFFLVYFLIHKFFSKQMGFGDVIYVTCYTFLLGNPYWIFFLNSAYVSAVGVYFIKKIFQIKTKPMIPMGFYFGLSFLLSYILKIYIDFRL